MRTDDPAVEIGFGIDGLTAPSTRQPFHSVPRAAVAEAVPVATGIAGQACTGVGAVAFDAARNGLVVCGTGNVWSDVGGCPAGTLSGDSGCVPCGAQAVLDEGPLYFWTLDDSGSTAVDATGRKDATYVGSIARSSSTPVFGSQGVTFSAGTTRIRATSFNPPVGDNTVMGWVQTTVDEAGLVSYAISGQANEWLPLYRPAQLSYLLRGAQEDTAVFFGDGNWHHVATSRVESTGVVTIYIDGQQAGTLTIGPGQSPAGGGTLVLGQEQDSVDGGFDANQALVGGLDDVAIFTSALDGPTIERIYRAQQCE